MGAPVSDDYRRIEMVMRSRALLRSLARIVDAYEAAQSVRATAEAMGLSSSTVQRLRDRAGLVENPRRLKRWGA